MYHVTLDYAKNHLEELLERVKFEPDGIVIVKDNQSFILIDQNELESLKETAEWLKDSAIIDDIKEAKQQYEQDDVLTMDQIFRNEG